jgi:hypothetical protein
VPHTLAYPGLILFTLVIYLRPNDFVPLGDFPIAKLVGGLVLGVFVFERLAGRQSLSVAPRELIYLLGLVTMMFLSVPLALDRSEALDTIFGLFIKVVLVFVLLINVVDSYGRLRRVMALTALCGAGIAVGTLWNFVAGERLTAGYRAMGALGGMFENPNDLALALNMLLPLAIGLGLTTRNPLMRILFLAGAAAMGAAVYITYSRGGLVALVAVGVYMLAKMGPRYPVVALFIALVAVGLVVFGPGGWGMRALSMFDSSLDVSGSSAVRKELLTRSLEVFAGNPKVWTVGLGAGNFHIVSIGEAVNHNSYLQVLTEVGAIAFACYMLFVLSALHGLKNAVTSSAGHASSGGVIAVAIRASIIAFLVGSAFLSVAYHWYLYYAVGYAVCLRQIIRAHRASRAHHVAPARQAA